MRHQDRVRNLGGPGARVNDFLPWCVGISVAFPGVMMCGYITEVDFDLVDEAFPGIVRYYLELHDKPKTFLELLWGFTHQCPCAEPVPVASSQAGHRAIR